MDETEAVDSQADVAYWLPQSAVDEPVEMALTADGVPVKPPRAWFANPGLTKVSPLHISADGHVFGHIAAWNQSHIGLAGSVKAPKSRSGYAFFATGALETAEGELVDVGQITLVGGHASLSADTARAVAHYDETRSGAVDVSIGEDKHGIWVSGALRPNITEEQIRILRASAVSGDWRPINGNLELVAICSVNVPGFPIPRARVASGQVMALVAAGVEPIVAARLMELSAAAIVDAVDAVSDRVAMLEEHVLSTLEEPATVETEPDSITISAEDLRTRVHGVKADAGDPVAALRSRVHRT